MQTIEIGENRNSGLADLVNSFSRLETPELKKVLEQLNQVLSHRDKPQPDDSQSQLLQKIKEAVPASMVRRFKQLHSKLQQNSISEKEHEELLMLTDFLEEKSAERIQLMGELAKIQQLTLPELAKKLRLREIHG